ncbi:hypothetical protein [Streptomyces sp. AP-93]|uniref:hypothetical protein n=1 Tax=Streptomyces sp. AP-93 TaxID=2929048 RepID=UPI001FAF60B7|nr:hypothetical protein [Streptomyces sp. AP-93]MCJ0874353.1 hypothetical protein [Streptomyces sp. AP-93]
MSIAPSLPILHGRKGTDLRVTGRELVLRRAPLEHRIPFAAIAGVHAEGRAVEVRLTAPAAIAPTVLRVEDVSEAAATAFARAVNAALAPADAAGSVVVDGSTLVTTRTAESEPETRTPREALHRKVKWLSAGSALVIVAMSVLVGFFGEPVNIVGIVLFGGTGFPLVIAAVVLAPEGLRPWRLPRHGITVTADHARDSAQPWLYLYSDLDGNVWKYLDSSGRVSVEVSYDPRDPRKAVRADGAGRWTAGILPVSAGIAGLILLAMFFVTPFMDFGPTGEEYRNQYR